MSDKQYDPTSADVERMTSREVMSLARISRATLWRRIGSGMLPAPVDQARQALFLKSAVLKALSGGGARPVAEKAERQLKSLREWRCKNNA